MRGFIKFCSIVIIMLVLSKSQAQESGVLLGLRFFRNDKPHYRTLWIAPQNGTFEVVAEGKGLLVPRKSGFWRVGIEREVYENWEEDFPWASPAEEVPMIQKIDPEEVEECEAENRSTILFVGNDYVSLEKESSGYCKGAAHPWCVFWLEVSSLDNLGMNAKCVSQYLLLWTQQGLRRCSKEQNPIMPDLTMVRRSRSRRPRMNVDGD